MLELKRANVFFVRVRLKKIENNREEVHGISTCYVTPTSLL